MTNDTAEFEGPIAAAQWAEPFRIRTTRLGVKTRYSLFDGLYRMDGLIYTPSKRPRPFGRWMLSSSENRGLAEDGPGVTPAKVDNLVSLVALYEKTRARKEVRLTKTLVAAQQVHSMLEERGMSRCVVPSARSSSGLVQITKGHSVSNMYVSDLNRRKIDDLSDLHKLGLIHPDFESVGAAFLKAQHLSFTAGIFCGRVKHLLVLACSRKLPRLPAQPHQVEPRFARIDVKDWTLTFTAEPGSSRGENGWRLHSMTRTARFDSVYTHLIFPGENNQKEK